MDSTLEKLYSVVLDRKAHPQEGSYTCYLFDKGLDKILKKVGEECAETGYPWAMFWLNWIAGRRKSGI